MSGHLTITLSDLRAIAIAHDELRSYLEVIGQEADLDDDEMPSGQLKWAEKRLSELLSRVSDGVSDG